MQLYHVLLHVHETWKLKKVHRGLNRSLQSTENKNKKPVDFDVLLGCYSGNMYLLREAHHQGQFLRWMQCYWEWEIPRNWNEKKKKNRLIIFQLLHPISIMGPKTRQINQERSILKECKLKVTGCTGRIHNTIFIFIRYARVDGMQIISD